MLKILVIDDNKDNIVVLDALLSESFPDVSIIAAMSGKEGLKKVKDENPDIILLDIVMPEMDGFEVCRILKNDDKFSHIPVIILTAARTDKESKIKVLNLGANAFLKKPIDEAELIAHITTMSRLKKAEDKLIQKNINLQKNVKQRTIALDKTLNILESFLDNSPAHFSIFNKDGQLKMVNSAYANDIELSKENIIGKKFFDLLPEDDTKIFMERINKLMQTKTPMVVEDKLILKGKEKYFETILFPILKTEENIGEIGAIATDITLRKQSEKIILQQNEELKAANKEKEVMLREIHHRVKNNMHIMQSLMNMQKEYTENEEIKNILNDFISRIKSIAQIHEILYQNDNFAKIDMQVYINNIFTYSYMSFASYKFDIQVDKEITNICLSIEEAMPIGLLVNEILSNIFKHGFKGKNKGKLSIKFKQKKNEYELRIKDDGVGLPANIEISNDISKPSKSYGMHLISILTQQLKGKIDIIRDNGTEFVLKFNG